MDLEIFQVDAFASDVFKGNPAAVVPLESWLPTPLLQSIAVENNLSETAFFVPHKNGAAGHYHLRWFTPGAEVELCGHATLASAYVLFEFLGERGDVLRFETLSGELVVERGPQRCLSMDFPSRPPIRLEGVEPLIKAVSAALGKPVESVWGFGEYATFVMKSEADLCSVEYSSAIDEATKASPYWALSITAPAVAGGDYDFVSRFFAPAKGISEDPVTGSAHCLLAPYWAERLKKNVVVGYQASARGGLVGCEVKETRVILSGRVMPYLKGRISIPGDNSEIG